VQLPPEHPPQPPEDAAEFDFVNGLFNFFFVWEDEQLGQATEASDSEKGRLTEKV